jgi:hypothetical protein
LIGKRSLKSPEQRRRSKMALIPWAFNFDSKQLEKLKELSRRTRIPQAVFVREALDYVLKKYSYLLTMTPFSPQEALAKLVGDRYEKVIEQWVGETGLSRLEVEQRLLRMIIAPPKILRVDEQGKVLEEWRPRKRRLGRSDWIKSLKMEIKEIDEKRRRAVEEIMRNKLSKSETESEGDEISENPIDGKLEK